VSATHPQWQPIIEDRQFVRWLVKMPTDDERLRARRLTPQQVREGGRTSGWLAVLLLLSTRVCWQQQQQQPDSLCLAGRAAVSPSASNSQCWLQRHRLKSGHCVHIFRPQTRRCLHWRTCGRQHLMPRWRTWMLQRCALQHCAFFSLGVFLRANTPYPVSTVRVCP
jgi:hypothetical protein